MERRGAALCSATLVLGAACHAQAGAARELVARSLLAHLLAVGSGELVVLARSTTDELRDELLGLVGRLLAEVDGSSVTIRLQFQRAEREPPCKSGVHAVAERSAATEVATRSARNTFARAERARTRESAGNLTRAYKSDPGRLWLARCTQPNNSCRPQTPWPPRSACSNRKSGSR